MDEPIFVSNAGLVLLAPFFPQLFREAGWLEERGFRGREEGGRAVHLLQRLVAEETPQRGDAPALNKVLCGFDPARPVEADLPLEESALALAEALLQTVAQRWPRGGRISVEGLRGNFLRRSGRLQRDAHGWSLKVDRRAWDLQLAELPWSFGRVHPAWMPEPLWVDWV